MSVVDWWSIGTGVVQVVQGMSSGSNGVSVSSDSISYHVEGRDAQGNEIRTAQGNEIYKRAVHVVLVHGPMSGLVSISLAGTFAEAGEKPPVLVNLRLYCDEQEGAWGTDSNEPELDFKADGLPTAVGTPQDPHLQFQCRLELRVGFGMDNAILHFVLDVDQHGTCMFGNVDFEYGEAWVDISTGYLEVTYDASHHG